MKQVNAILNLLKAIYELLNLYINKTPKKIDDKDIQDNLYNRKEAAAYLLVHPKTVTNWRNRAILPATSGSGKNPSYHQKDLDRCYEWHWGRPKNT